MSRNVNKVGMTYFGHQTDAMYDIKCQRLLNKLGSAGYGAFWILVETAARHITTTVPMEEWGTVDPKYEIDDLAALCRLEPKEMRHYLKIMDEIGLTAIQMAGGTKRLFIPNLLKHLSRFFAEKLSSTASQMDATAIQKAGAAHTVSTVSAVHSSTAHSTKEKEKEKRGSAKSRTAHPNKKSKTKPNPPPPPTHNFDLGTQKGRVAYRKWMEEKYG